MGLSRRYPGAVAASSRGGLRGGVGICVFAGAVRYRCEQATRHLVQSVRDPTRRKRVGGAYPSRRKPRNDLEGVEREEGMKKNICVFTFGGTWEVR